MRKNALEQEKREPGLKFYPGLAIIGLWTTGPIIGPIIGPRGLVLVRPSSWGRGEGYVNPLCENQNPSFHVWIRKPYPCRYFRIVYTIVLVVVVVLTHFYVSFSRHFICLWSLLPYRLLEFYRSMTTVVSRPLVAQKGSLQWSCRAQLFEGRLALNPGFNFNPGLFFFSSKAFSCTIFSILFRVANHQIVNKKN